MCVFARQLRVFAAARQQQYAAPWRRSTYARPCADIYQSMLVELIKVMVLPPAHGPLHVLFIVIHRHDLPVSGPDRAFVPREGEAAQSSPPTRSASSSPHRVAMTLHHGVIASSCCWSHRAPS